METFLARKKAGVWQANRMTKDKRIYKIISSYWSIDL